VDDPQVPEAQQLNPWKKPYIARFFHIGKPYGKTLEAESQEHDNMENHLMGTTYEKHL
jgi:hypothetical protein